jgi:hypothetical protein
MSTNVGRYAQLPPECWTWESCHLDSKTVGPRGLGIDDRLESSQIIARCAIETPVCVGFQTPQTLACDISKLKISDSLHLTQSYPDE